MRTRGVFTHRAGFQKLACAKRGLVRTGQHFGGRAWCARRVNYFQASSEPTAAPATKATHQPHHQHQKPRANQTSSPDNITHQPASTTSPTPETTRQSSQQPRQHHTPTRSNHITSTRSHAPIKPAAPATSHTNPHQPHHQHQKLRANQAGSPGNTTHQQHHQRHINRITNAKTARQPRHQSWQNRISSNKSRAPTESPPSATPRANHLTSAACINASCTATGRRRTFP